jgi:hypothetical protein
MRRLLADEPATSSDPTVQEPGSPDVETTAPRPDSEEAVSESVEQQARERRIWFALIAGGALVLLVFLLAFWPVMKGRLNAAKQLDDATALLKQARGSVSDVDRLVAAQLSAQPSATAPDVSPQILVARRELMQIDTLIDDAMPHLTEDEQRRAVLLREAADARLGMLAAAPALLKLSAKSARALAPANAAWRESQLADQTEASANAQYAKQTALSVRMSSDSYGQASTQVKTANSLYSQAASAFPEAGYNRYVDQGNLRIVALKSATASAASWVSGNKAIAATQHAQYVSQSAKAQAAAKALPSPPGRAAGDAFERLAGASRQAYEAARAKVVAADEALSTL